MKALIFISAGMLFLVGCQTVPYQGQARDVKRRPGQEGVVSVALIHRPEDRAKADELMKSNCGEHPVDVLEEGEAVVGQSTQTSGKETDRKSTEHSMGKFLGMNITGGEEAGKNTTSSTVTTDVKEWRIAYKCALKSDSKKR